MITEKEFELYKKIFELQNSNTGLTVAIVVVSIACMLLLVINFLRGFEDK